MHRWCRRYLLAGSGPSLDGTRARREPRQWGSPSSPVLRCFQDQAGMLLGVLWCRLDGWFLPGGPRYSRPPCTVAVRPPASMFLSVSGRAEGF